MIPQPTAALRRVAPQVAALILSALALPAQAQTSPARPWSLGVAQTITHDSNLYRLSDDAAVQPGDSRSDTIYTTALLAGLDQPISRQRLFAEAVLRDQRFGHNDRLDHQGHTLKLGLDWATVGHLSGRLEAGATRTLTAFDTDLELGTVTDRNIENRRQVTGIVRLGVVTRLSLEGRLSHERVSYSAPAYEVREMQQTGGSFGLRYRPDDRLSWGLGLDAANSRYPLFRARGDGSYEAELQRRRGAYLALALQASGASRLDMRWNLGRVRYEQAAQRDHSGLTGSVGWRWQPGERLELNTRLTRSSGQDTTAADTEPVFGLADQSRTSTTLKLQAAYQLTAKVDLDAQVRFGRRDLVRTVVSGSTEAGTAADLQGSDRLQAIGVGVRWAPTRSLSLRCDLAREQRRSDGVLSRPYSTHSAGCSGQFVLN
jgi:hypothetical protein